MGGKSMRERHVVQAFSCRFVYMHIKKKTGTSQGFLMAFAGSLNIKLIKHFIV